MLFLKECKKVIFSMTFVLYVVTVIAMYVTQFCHERPPLRPLGQEPETMALRCGRTRS